MPTSPTPPFRVRRVLHTTEPTEEQKADPLCRSLARFGSVRVRRYDPVTDELSQESADLRRKDR